MAITARVSSEVLWHAIIKVQSGESMRFSRLHVSAMDVAGMFFLKPKLDCATQKNLSGNALVCRPSH
jgi:hypothetical protein